MSVKSIPLAVGLLLGILAGSPFVAQALAQDGDMIWQFYEANDPDNKGAMTARLVYGVPETDNVQVIGVCDARPSTSAKFSSVTFGADIGDLANAQDADLRFSGGGYEQTLQGTIQRSEGEGPNGVHLDIENGDTLWTAFAEKDTLDYSVPGYRAASLKLGTGRDKIESFVEACRTYQRAILGSDETDAAEPESASPEKEAFDSAKELGTVAAFEAFLANFPTGFYADLARAYIDKLNAADSAAASAPEPEPAPVPTVVASDPGPDPSCDDLSTLRSQSADTPAKITFVNRSGMYRSILWLDFNGQPKDYGGMNDGEDLTLDTFLTHPWMIADGPGNCIEIVMPHAGARVVTLTNPGAAAIPAPPPPTKKASPPPPPFEKKKAVAPKCRSRSVLIDGKCVLKRDAATYCGPGYRLQGGKCVHGYVAPKPQIRFPTWQLKGRKHGCPPGLAWNAQEGCHEND